MTDSHSEQSENRPDNTPAPATQMETNELGEDLLCDVRSTATIMVNNVFSSWLYLSEHKIQIFSDTLVAFANEDNVKTHIQKRGSGELGKRLFIPKKSISKMWSYMSDIIGDRLRKEYTIERFKSFLDEFVTVVIRDIRQRKARDKK